MIRALVAVGTNSTRLLVHDGRSRLAESRGTRIGTGIASAGALDPEASARTLAAIDDYAQLASAAGAQTVDCIATSALRRAADGTAFGAEVAARIGVAPRILSGDEEAAFSFLGATAVRGRGGPVGVLDVGGGSAELAVGTGRPERTLSVEVGAVRLAERHPALLGAAVPAPEERIEVERAARADAAAALAAYARLRGIPELIAVGGTAVNAAAIVHDGFVDGGVLTRAAVGSLIERLLALDVAARRALPHVRPQRADILPAGLIVIDEAARLLGVSEMAVTTSDLLVGYLTSPAYRAVPFPAGGMTGT